MTREIWAREHLVSYLAGGLTTEERFEIQERLKTDADLAADLDELRGFDERMRRLFVASKPPLALEDRVIQSIRNRATAAPRRGVANRSTRALLVAASLLFVVLGGAVGVVLITGTGGRMEQAFLSKETTYFPQGALIADPPGMLSDLSDGEDRYAAAHNFRLKVAKSADGRQPDRNLGEALENELLQGVNGAATAQPWGEVYWEQNGRLSPRAAKLGLEDRMEASALTPSRGLDVPADMKDGLAKHLGAVPLVSDLYRRSGATRDGSDDKGKPSDRGDSAKAEMSKQAFGGAPQGRIAQDPVAAPPVPTNAPSRGFGMSTNSSGLGTSVPAAPPASPLLEPRFATAGVSGVPGDGFKKPLAGRAETGVEGVYAVDVNKNQQQRSSIVTQNWHLPADAFKEMTKGKPGHESSFSPPAGLGFADTKGDYLSYAFTAGGSAPDGKKGGRFNGPMPAMDDQAKDADKVGSADTKNSAKAAGESKRDEPPVVFNSTTERPPQVKDKDGDKKPEEGQAEAAKPGEPKKTSPPPQEKADPKQFEPKHPPTARRIVIRSGEIEFEVDSFDQAVGIIYKVIGQTKGGIISTTNSDKLENGKMRGAVVVRMPPEELDDFVAALRRDLGKSGELKNQRIGSQDVTKQYTDMESELRGLRVSEDRLIGMLKETKGQLKDLLAVETQLAKTRTSIERIEGELRYYANLAAMSTLTINLHEKEIRIAAGVVESERVQAGVEAEDVDTAFQAAKAAIDEFKGRVYRSEMKQGQAGQFNAILQFEIAPESTGLMRDRLKQIGTVARLEIDRVQKVEGGGAANRDSKVKRGDTQFFVSIYNLANVEPRETVIATVVGSDVPASYQKIRDLVAKLKGNLRNTSLQNSDARNVVAVLDFDIRRADEPALQAALAAAGEILTRRVERKAQTDNVTDTKVLFALRLVSVGGITARESNNLSLAALDVPSSYRKVRDAVVKAKGYMRNANLQETDKANIAAALDFDVLRTDEDAIVAALAGAGEILTRRVDRRPEGENVTDAKIGFVVSMVSVASINARETTQLQIAATDVPAAFAKLREAASKAKAQIRTANLQENDRENMSATLEFDVLRADEDTILAALAAAGEQLKRQVDRQASGANVTDAKVLFKIDLVSASGIEPREVYVLHIRVDKVEEKLKVFQALVSEAHGRVVTGPLKKKTQNGKMEAGITYDVPLISAGAVAEMFKNAGNVTGQNEEKNPKAPEGKLALARFRVTLFDAEPLMPNDEGFGAQLRNGMSVGLRGLSLTTSYLILAIVIVGPWLLAAWVVYVLARRTFGQRPPTVVAAPPPPAEPVNS